MEQTDGATSTPGSDRRTWLIGAVLVAVLVAIAVAGVVLTSTREVADYDSGSAEAAVKAYAQAWEVGDTEAAHRLLTPRAQERVELAVFRDAMAWDEEVPTRVWVEDRRDFGERVVLTLGIERTWDGLFGPDREIESLRVALLQLDGEWRIDTPMVGFNFW